MTKYKKRWKKQEGALNREGIRSQPGSGNGHLKGDNIGTNYLVQCKTTANKSVSIKLADWRKAQADAYAEERTPVMQVELCDGEQQLAVLAWSTFRQLLTDAGMEL